MAKIRFIQSSLERSVVTYAQDSNTEEKLVFVQANSGQGHILHYITSFWVVFSLSTPYFWLAGKTKTKQVVNRMSKWIEGSGSWKRNDSGRRFYFSRGFAARSFSSTPDKNAMLRGRSMWLISVYLSSFMSKPVKQISMSDILYHE